MKMSEIKKMTVLEILDKFDFPVEFVEDFQNWCQLQPTEEQGYDSIQGLSKLIYKDGPFTKMIPSTQEDTVKPLTMLDRVKKVFTNGK